MGTGRRPAEGVKWATMLASYDEASHTLSCQNCGGQTMTCVGTGKVPLREDGSPCLHEYKGVQAGNCYIRYTCVHCGDSYGIDSSG
ncbi:MAG: hypothetical protein EBW66_05190 [Actinobacteria bacterium]|nr:hypothetical protein [Actinomycetota bacterium]